MVFWIGNYWFFLGVLVLAESFFIGYVNWTFWKKKNKKSFGYDVIDAIIIAIVAVLFIRIFFFEAFSIPTSSMEKSIQVGDYIMVNKLNYGPRIPNTPLSLPFTHNSFSLKTSFPSYLTWIKLPYKRLKGFSTIKKNDIIVFNFPEGDTVISGAKVHRNETYYTLARKYGKNTFMIILNSYTDLLINVKTTIKRVVAIPGDSLIIEHGLAKVNGILEENC
ncbi:MAG: signal peptidase I [Bacteroidales bacterium]|nr:signal peptidase I [Bacteroidales bacterium]